MRCHALHTRFSFKICGAVKNVAMCVTISVKRSVKYNDHSRVYTTVIWP